MKTYQWLLLIGIFILSFFLRFYSLERIPPGIHGDEAEFGLTQQKINHGLYEKFFSFAQAGADSFSILSFWTQGLFQRVIGENAFGIRATSAFIGTITILFFFFLSRLFFKDKFIPFILTFALATSHWHIAYSHMAINNIWCPFFVVIVSFYLCKGYQTHKNIYFLFAGMFMGFSLYFPQSDKIIPIIIFIYSFLYLLKRQRFIKRNVINTLSLFITACIIFSPQAIYFLHNPSTLTGRINTVSIFNHLPEYYARYHANNVFEVLFWQIINTLKVFNFGGDIGFYFYGYQGGLLAPIVGTFAVIGLFLSFLKIKKDKYLFLLVWFFLVIIFGGVITIDAPSSQRLVGIIPVLFLFAGATLEQIMKYKIRYLKVILIFLFVINGIWDYKIYFIEYIHSQAGWAQREPATQIAYYIKSLGPSWKVYMLRENTWLYFNHGTIRFLNPDIEGIDIDNSETVIPFKDVIAKNIVYIMPPDSPTLLNIRQHYPQGKERYHRNEIGNTPSFISYEIKNSYLSK